MAKAYELVECLGMQRSASSLQYELVEEILKNREAPATPFEKKTHIATPEHYSRMTSGKSVITYIWRDLRDVVASVKNMNWDWPWERDVEEAVRTWFTVRQWHIEHPDRVIIQQYHQAFDDFRGLVRQLAEFLDVTCTEEDIDRIERTWSIPKIQEAHPGIDYLQMKELFPNHKEINANQGASVWREELQEEDLNYLYDNHQRWFDAAGIGRTR